MRALIFSLLVSSFTSTVFADNERVFDYRGTKYVTKVPNEAPTEPAWTPGATEPPLTLGAAAKLADTEFNKTFAAFGTFKLQSITLTKQGSGWMYYVVYLQDAKDISDSRPGPSGGTLKTPLPVIYYITFDGVVRGPEPTTK
jgi:hypothetical protein